MDRALQVPQFMVITDGYTHTCTDDHTDNHRARPLKPSIVCLANEKHRHCEKILADQDRIRLVDMYHDRRKRGNSGNPSLIAVMLVLARTGSSQHPTL
jgi:hypothetical protein